MNNLVLKIGIFTFLHLLLLSYSYERVPKLVKVRKRENAKEAEYVALDFIGLMEEHGRKAVAHNVTTEDGYILTLFRLFPNSTFSQKSKKNNVIFLVHGLAASSDVFIIFGPGKSLACLLSDDGYDVWAGNFRGNTYSRSHKNLSPEDKNFWDFSIDELGIFDLPAMLNYILETTGESSLTYVGHSLGSTAMLMLLSTKPEYNDKIDMAIYLGPVAYWITKSPMRTIMSSIGKMLQNLFEPTGRNEIFPQSAVYSALLKICETNNILELCFLPFELIFGADPGQMDKDLFISCAKYYPAGTSVKILYHFRQHAQNSKFRHYDYENEELNLKYYGESEPPEYNLKNIKIPTVIFHGKNDLLSTAADIKSLIFHLPENIPILFETIDYKNFNHLDFISATDVKELIYNRLIEILIGFHKNKFEKNQNKLN